MMRREFDSRQVHCFAKASQCRHYLKTEKEESEMMPFALEAVSCVALCEAGQNIMYYVYIIQSKKDNSYYTGCTEDLKNRINEHNTGKAKFTSTKMDYILAWYCAFNDKKKALNFEKYLKQGSGFAFARKRLV